ncbi:MAG: hypothetical protein WBM07_06265 [Chitinivibrionales bacterium]
MSLRAAGNHLVEKAIIVGKSIKHRRIIITVTAARHLSLFFLFAPFYCLCFAAPS